MEHVVGEMMSLKERFGACQFRFLDNDLGINRRWLFDFCRKVRALGQVQIDGVGRANLLDYDLLKAMHDAGFSTISVGAESGCDRVLRDIMNKKTTVEQIVRFTENCYRIGIMANAYWMIANPGESLEEMKATIELASDLPTYYCHFHIANPNPGTRYYLNALDGGYLRMESWNDVHDRSKPALLTGNISPADIAEIDRLLVSTMVRKGWRYEQNGHTLSFYNTRLYVKRQPVRALGNEVLAWMSDHRGYHFRNLGRGLVSMLGKDEPV